MHPTLRSAAGRTRLDAVRSREALSSCVRQFSSTSIRAESEDNNNNSSRRSNNPASSPRERSFAAANEISDLLRSKAGNNQNKNNNANSNNKAPPGIDPSVPFQRFNPKAGGANNNNGSRQTSPNVIGLKSVPRGIGRGNFGSGLLARPPPNFARGGGPPRPGGRFPGRGGPGANRGRGGARGGNRAATRKPRKSQEELDEERQGVMSSYARYFRPDTVEEHRYTQELKHGSATTFRPSLTVESLMGYGPAIPAGNTRAKGELVLQNLRALGGGAPFAPEQRDAPSAAATQLYYGGGVKFFSSLEDRATAEAWMAEHGAAEVIEPRQADPKLARREAPSAEMKGAEDVIKAVVTRQGVQGEHEKPVFSAGRDAAALARNMHLRAETYRKKDVETFEAKVKSLVRAQQVGGGSGAKKQGKAARA